MIKAGRLIRKGKKEDEDSSTDSVDYYDTESTSEEEEVKRKRNEKDLEYITWHNNKSFIFHRDVASVNA